MIRPLANVVLTIRILVVAASVPLLMRLRLSTVEAVIEPRRPPPDDRLEDVPALVHHIEAVLRRGRPLVRPGCLSRGVTLFYFLRRAGLDVTLVFGVGDVDRDAKGHCWLVRDGEPFLEHGDPRRSFVEIVAIPGTPQGARH